MIGQRLRILRKEKGVRQEELAAAIGVQKSSISLYETDKNDLRDKKRPKSQNILMFHLLLDDMDQEERNLLCEFRSYLDYRRQYKE